jgi:hypothetical protein
MWRGAVSGQTKKRATQGVSRGPGRRFRSEKSSRMECGEPFRPSLLAVLGQSRSSPRSMVIDAAVPLLRRPLARYLMRRLYRRATAPRPASRVGLAAARVGGAKPVGFQYLSPGERLGAKGATIIPGRRDSDLLEYCGERLSLPRAREGRARNGGLSSSRMTLHHFYCGAFGSARGSCPNIRAGTARQRCRSSRHRIPGR